MLPLPTAPQLSIVHHNGSEKLDMSRSKNKGVPTIPPHRLNAENIVCPLIETNDLKAAEAYHGWFNRPAVLSRLSYLKLSHSVILKATNFLKSVPLIDFYIARIWLRASKLQMCDGHNVDFGGFAVCKVQGAQNSALVPSVMDRRDFTFRWHSQIRRLLAKTVCQQRWHLCPKRQLALQQRDKGFNLFWIINHGRRLEIAL